MAVPNHRTPPGHLQQPVARLLLPHPATDLFIEDIDAHGAFDVPEDPGEVAASSGSPSEAIGS